MGGPAVRALAALVAALLIGSTTVLAQRIGTGSGADEPKVLSAPGPGPSPTAAATEVQESPSIGPTPATAVTSPKKKSSPRASPSPTRTVDDPHRLPLDVRVEPACAAKGERLTAVIQSDRDVHVTLAAAYSDGQAYDTWAFGSTDRRGRYEFTWLVPVDAPEGDGVVLVAASDDRDRSGTGSAGFRVAGAGGCR